MKIDRRQIGRALAIAVAINLGACLDTKDPTDPTEPADPDDPPSDIRAILP